ncbi:MAG: peptidase U32 family protein, partial [Chitinophagaceae bacterium]
CYLSLHTQNASANRGACVQNCRRKYKVTDLEDNHELVIDNEYILSPKDLCTLPFLDKLIDAGVKVLKIEGRGKGAAYVKKTTQCYVEAVKAIQDGSFTPEKVANWLHLLEEEYNRGFWGGYYLGKPTGEWTNAPGSLATTRKIYVGKGQHYYPKIGVAEFVLEAYGLAVNDRILITGPTTGVIETTVTSLHVNNDGAKEQAVKGDTIAIPVSQPIRSTDKLYKVVQTAENVEL